MGKIIFKEKEVSTVRSGAERVRDHKGTVSGFGIPAKSEFLLFQAFTSTAARNRFDSRYE